MLASVEVMPAAEFDSWYEERLGQQQAGTSPLGEELWVGTCAKCHGLDGEGGYGPRIAGTDLIKNTQSIEALLRNGRDPHAARRPGLDDGRDGRADRPT